MKLPNGQNAYIPKEKLIGYLLSEVHPVGKFKAKFFKKLGFHEASVDKFERVLLEIAHTNEVEGIKELPYGVNYTIKGIIQLPRQRTVEIKTVWFIESGKRRPRFVTTIPGIITKRKNAHK